MKVWILLVLAGLLLAWGLLRERFEATPSIKAPPYDEAEKRRIFDMVHQRSPRRPYPFLGYQTILMDKAKEQLPNETNEDKLKETAGAFVTPAIESFFNTVFKPATTPITEEQVDSFVDARSSDIKMIEKDVLKTYFVGQSGVGTSGGGGSSYAAALAELGQGVGYLSQRNPPPVCPAGTILNSQNKCVGMDSSPFTCPTGYEVSGTTCRRIGGTETTAPICPAGKTFSSEAGACEGSPVDPTCPSGREYRDGQCKPIDSGSSSTTSGSTTGGGSGGGSGSTTGGGSGGGSGSTTGGGSASTTSGTTTGGGSVSAYGPNSGGTGRRNRQVFGPVFTATGESNNDNGDSSKTNVYPELLGGMPDTSTRIPGVGVVAPSKSWQLMQNGSLPSFGSLGADAASRFLPYSRQPGDMDVIPDPYRVSKTFSTSSYSSKTEPTPFLTDFSAFLK